MDLLYIGSNGHVSAVNPGNGQEMWRTTLKKGMLGSGVDVNVIEHNGIVFAGCYGELFGLEARTGRILWKNGLKGYGYNDISMSIAGKHVQSMSKPHQQQA